MKKLALSSAISLLVASGAASAATIYEKDNVSWKMSGDIQIQFLQQIGTDQDLDLDYDDAELKNRFAYKLDNGWTAFAESHYDFKKAKTEETFVGIDFGGVKVWYGDTTWATDGFGVEQAIDLKISEDAFPESDSDDVILAEFKAGTATILVSHDIEGSFDEDTVGKTAMTSSDIMVTVPAGPVKLQFAYQALTESVVAAGPVVNDTDTNTVGVSAKGKFGSVNAGVAFSSADKDGEDNKREVVGAFVGTAGFNVGYETTDEHDGTDFSTWYANYTHTLTKNVTVFAEIGDNDKDDTDMGYLAGMRVKF